MHSELQQKLEQAIWIGKSLFERNKTAGSSANMSFLHENTVSITGSGTCFGTLKAESFSTVDLSGAHIDGPSPSKELPLHLGLYNQKPEIKAVIHTHSFYSVLWSCLPHANPVDIIPTYTPYLKMRLGTVGLVPYAPPGSAELFKLFSGHIDKSDGYMLANHGPVVGSADLLSAFYALEELEESAHLAWEFCGKNIKCL